MDCTQILGRSGTSIDQRFVVLHHCDHRRKRITTLVALAVSGLDPELHRPGCVGTGGIFCLGGAADDKDEFALIHRAFQGIGDLIAVQVRHRVPIQGKLLGAADFFAGNLQPGGSRRRTVVQ